jgi:hypothetical protein
VVCVVSMQTDVEFRKGKRTLEMKEKNNFLATANVRETEFISKKARATIEPSDSRYDEHLNFVNTPPSAIKTPSCVTVDNIATSSGKPMNVAKDEIDTDTEEKKEDQETSSEKAMSMVVRKAFLGLF